jgi:hypothetical protein
MPGLLDRSLIADENFFVRVVIAITARVVPRFLAFQQHGTPTIPNTWGGELPINEKKAQRIFNRENGRCFGEMISRCSPTKTEHL